MVQKSTHKYLKARKHRSRSPPPNDASVLSLWVPFSSSSSSPSPFLNIMIGSSPTLFCRQPSHHFSITTSFSPHHRNLDRVKSNKETNQISNNNVNTRFEATKRDGYRYRYRYRYPGPDLVASSLRSELDKLDKLGMGG